MLLQTAPYSPLASGFSKAVSARSLTRRAVACMTPSPAHQQEIWYIHRRSVSSCDPQTKTLTRPRHQPPQIVLILLSLNAPLAHLPRPRVGMNYTRRVPSTRGSFDCDVCSSVQGLPFGQQLSSAELHWVGVYQSSTTSLLTAGQLERQSHLSRWSRRLPEGLKGGGAFQLPSLSSNITTSPLLGPSPSLYTPRSVKGIWRLRLQYIPDQIIDDPFGNQ